MQNFYKLFCLLIFCFFCAVSQNLLAQPPNDECSGAIDISEAFMGSCGDFTFNGPFDLTGSTPGVDDPPEPGESPTCPGETDTNLFGDDSEEWENSVWYTWTVPDLNGDGSDVAYSIWTTDGSFGDDCGLNPNAILGGDADTQVAMYKGADCPNSSTGECDHFAANEDLFTSPPWISGWLTLEFTPGETYYMAVDAWDGAEGEFCLTVVICGVECGDSECAPVEAYCDCADCQTDADGNSLCTFGNIAPIEFVEDDPETTNDESGFFFADDLEGNLFFCSEFVNGYSGANTYLGFGATNWTDCTGAESASIDLTLSAGQFTGGAEDNGDGTVNIPTGSLLYLELTPEEIAAGSITISSSVPDGIGNACEETLTINFADFPQATDPFCVLSCFAGGMDTDLIDNGITVCQGSTFTINTDGLEDLTLACNSDDGSSYVYAWRVLVDLYGTGDYAVVTSWQPMGTPATIDPLTFFVDEFGYAPPYFTAGSVINPTIYGNPTPIRVQGAALCLNADGTIVDGCVASNEGYESSQVNISYLPEGDAGCPADCAGVIDCAGVCDGTATVGSACDVAGAAGFYDTDCNCVVPVLGCTDAAACNFNDLATEDDGSCQTLDCADECGGAATEGTDCDAAGSPGTYAADCTCVPTPDGGPVENDECITAPDISSAFTEECERIGPYDQTGATIGDAEPPLPACFLDEYNSTTWYVFTLPDGTGGGQPTGYSISTGAFEDCAVTNALGGDRWDTQMAIYDGESGCPNASSVPLECNDDVANLPVHPEVSSIDINLTPGNTYYIMIETFGTLDGEFCFYIAPTAKPSCVDCGDNSCTEVFGEDFSTCPDDCPCVGDVLANTIDPGTGFPVLTLDHVALCPEDVGATGGGLYIPFSITSDNVPVGADNITYDGSTLSTSVGTIYNFVFGGAPALPPTAEGTKNVTLVYLTADEVAAGVTPTVTFVDATGACTISLNLDIILDESTCPANNCEISSSTLALADGSDATSICVDDGVDEPIAISITTTGSGENSSWVITDLTGNALAVPADGPPFVLDGAGEGECLIWMLNWCGDLSEALAVGVNVPSVVATSEAAISNPITVVRNINCGTPVPGCMDMDACNYNPDATEDDGSCTVEDCAGVCGGDAIEDCAGVCGGDSVEDCAGVCGGDATEDCAGVCGGDAAVDCAGVCNGDAVVDCAGVCGGDATEDCAGVCGGDAVEDCGGVCGGDAIEDCNGVCGGDAVPGAACEINGMAGTLDMDCVCQEEPVGCMDSSACNYDPDATIAGPCEFEDCAGVCGGDAIEDCAGVCNGDAVEDCAGVCGGDAVLDCAGVCGGDAVLDCAGVCGGDTVEDCAGVCGGDATEDCAGVCGGDAVEDCAGVCGGDATADCAGVCGGDATEDCNGVCGGDATLGADCGTNGTIDANCVCQEGEVPGCTDVTACNYNSDATIDDGSCTVEDCAGVCGGDSVEDCAGVCNGNSVEDCAGVCDGDATEDCNSVCGGDAIPGAACGINGTLDMNCVCQEENGIVGCMDDTACNYNPDATEAGPCNVNDCVGNCGGSATTDCAGVCGGSATAGSACDDGDASTINDVYNASCECAGTPDVNPEDCASVAGTIGLADGGEYSSMGFICDGETAIITASDFILLPGQAVCYVFHEDGIVSSTNPLQNALQFGSFFTNADLGKKEIYATAFGARKMLDGSPDYSDPCITYSNTITITLLNPVEIDIDENCESDKGEFTFTITVSGGLPECVPSTSFEVTGDYWNGILSNGQSQAVGPIQDAENYTVTATDDNGCTYTVSKSVNCTKLPIELISFDGEALEEGNMLKWVTATEIENEYYTIESSTNGVDFKAMATVQGNGTTSSVSNYVYLDRTANKGITYYRLSQTDFDGSTAEVGVIGIERGETSFNIMDLYPIPTSDFINVDFMAPEQSIIDIEVYDLIGKTIETFRTTSVGSNLLKLEVSDYPVGVYFISIKSNDSKVTQKFVVE